MTKVVPYKKDFDLVSLVDKISNSILWSSVVASIATIIISYSKIEQTTENILTTVLNSIICFLAVSYFLSDIISNYLFQKAEAKRRDDFFDNSLNTSHSEENSNEYFTNDNITPSIKKMGVNCFENSFFTKSVSAKMLKPMIINSIVVFLLFLILAITNNHLFVTALQIALPYTIIQQTIRLFVFHNRIENICKRFRQIFTTHNKKTITKSILHNVSSYETTLSWACIKLDSKLFDKMNDELSENWNKIKTKCNIA